MPTIINPDGLRDMMESLGSTGGVEIPGPVGPRQASYVVPITAWHGAEYIQKLHQTGVVTIASFFTPTELDLSDDPRSLILLLAISMHYSGTANVDMDLLTQDHNNDNVVTHATYEDWNTGTTLPYITKIQVAANTLSGSMLRSNDAPGKFLVILPRHKMVFNHTAGGIGANFLVNFQAVKLPRTAQIF